MSTVYQTLTLQNPDFKQDLQKMVKFQPSIHAWTYQKITFLDKQNLIACLLTKINREMFTWLWNGVGLLIPVYSTLMWLVFSERETADEWQFMNKMKSKSDGTTISCTQEYKKYGTKIEDFILV